MACAKALDILPELVCHTVGDVESKEEVIKVMRPVLMSKQYGYEDFLSELIADACIGIYKEKKAFNVDYVRVCKLLGSGVLR